MVPVDAAGKFELRVRGSNVTPGYWKRPDLTEAAFDEEGLLQDGRRRSVRGSIRSL
jgi:feruloyl-CoA synthase